MATNSAEYWDAKEKRDIEKDGVITMLSCISSACNKYPGARVSDERVLEAAEKFYAAAAAKKVRA